MFRFINLFLMIAMSLMLTACGGGGSSSAVISGSTYTMTGMTLSPASINGTSATTSVSVQIREQNNGIINAYSAATVTFTSICSAQGKASIGTVLAANGTYTATYTNNGCSGTDIISANAIINGQNLNPITKDLSISGVVQTIGDLTITAANTNVPADGKTQTAIRVFVSSNAASSGTSGTTGTPMVGVTVSFATSKGALSAPTAVTDSQGYASVYLISDTQAGQATVTASANGFLRSVSVGMGSLTPPARLVVTSDTPVRPNSNSTITALALDAYGQPVANANLIFEVTTNISGGKLLAYSATTNAQGIASVVYQAGSQISYKHDDVIKVNTSNSISQSVNVNVNNVTTNDTNIANMDIVLGATDLPADSHTQLLVAATLTNSVNLPLSGVTVSFSSTLGTFAATTAVTDDNGVARTYLTSATAGTAAITAAAGGFVRMSSVNFTPSTSGNGGSSGSSTIQMGVYNGSSFSSGTISAPTTITANGSATLRFNLWNTATNTAYTTDASSLVTLSSNCALMGKATIGTPTAIGNGVYTVTYTDTGCTLGSDTVTAAATINYQNTTASATFAINAATSSSTIQLGYHNGTAFIPNVIYGGGSSTNIAANSSTTLRVNVWDTANNAPYLTDTSSNFSVISQCQLTGKATIGSVTNLGNGVYSFTYTDAGCSLTNAQNIITAKTKVSGQDTNSATTTLGTTKVTSGNVQMGSCTINAACTGASFTQATLKPAVASLSAGGQTTISGVLWDTTGLAYYNSLTQVNLTSVCAAAGKATISNTSATNGQFSTTYQDNGCATTDTITATATINGTNLTATTTLAVAADTAGSIQFISATPTTIALQGTGLTTQSAVKFQVYGASTAIPVAGQTVTFALSTTAGGVTIYPSSATTDSNGYATTTVSAGTTPTPVRVIATSGGVSTQSSQLSISTTLPDQPHFSMAATTPNPTGAWDVQGTNTTINILLADQFSNPPPAGTVVNFRAESGQITPTCSTDANGACSVTWTTQTANNNPPLPYDGTTSAGTVCYNNPTNINSTRNNSDQGCINKAGRVTIMAWVTGSEGFIDNNNNGTFDDGDALATTPANYANPPVSLSDYFYFDRRDLPPPYLDANYNFVKETGAANSGIPNEFEVPNAQPTASDYTGKYNGALCQRTDNMCSSQKSIYLFRNMEIVMPTRSAKLTVWDNATTLHVGNITAAGTYYALIQDDNGNTMGDGTSIAIAASSDSVNLKVDATPPTIDKQAGYGHVVAFSVSDSGGGVSGSVQINVTSGGITTTQNVTVSGF